ncbi:MAG: hypothetical protein SFX72_20930 [Isosphaeraceae bacterium]|nr:hypothetical protein [Isosphaeraceae bacterium]
MIAHARKSARLFTALLSIVLLADTARAGNLSLDFDVDGVLPGATGQGFRYVGTLPESTAFQVTGGVLKIDTISRPGEDFAYYETDGVYDSQFSAELTVRARVTRSDNFGLGFAFYDPQATMVLAVRRNGWSIFGLTAGSLPDSTDFRIWNLKTSGVTRQYELRVDGMLISSGVLPRLSVVSQFWLGDGTSGGDVAGEIDYLEFANPAVVVPEPGTIAAALSGTILAVGLRSIRGRRRASAA